MKNWMKKGTSVVLAGAFMMSMAGSAFAADAETVKDHNLTAVVSTEKSYLGVSQAVGTVQEVTKTDNGSMDFTVKLDNSDEVMIFHTSDYTIFYDAKTGLPLMDQANTVGQSVRVYYGPAVTASIPAQSAAAAIIFGTDADGRAPQYAEVEALQKKDDGSIVVTTDSGTRLVTLTKDMPISPYMTRNIVTLDDVQVGSRLLLWYDVMTMSMPGYAGADKAILLPGTVAGLAEKEATTEAEGITMDKMVPVRATAEKFGYSVEWLAGNIIIKAPEGPRTLTLTIGSTDAGINKMLVKLDKAPELIDGVAYAPESFFNEAFMKVNE